MAHPRVYSPALVLVAYLAHPSDTYIVVTSLLPYSLVVLRWMSSDSVIQALNLTHVVSGLEVSSALLCCSLMFLLLLGQCLSLLAVECMLTKYSLSARAPTQGQEGPAACTHRPGCPCGSLSIFTGCRRSQPPRLTLLVIHLREPHSPQTSVFFSLK